MDIHLVVCWLFDAAPVPRDGHRKLVERGPQAVVKRPREVHLGLFENVHQLDSISGDLAENVTSPVLSGENDLHVWSHYISSWVPYVVILKPWTVRGARQLMGDEGTYLPNGRLVCLWNAKTIETVHEGQKPNLFDNWADTNLHLLLVKSSTNCLNS